MPELTQGSQNLPEPTHLTQEGFEPKQFTSSRANRAGHVQRVEDFLDEDEIEERRAQHVRTRAGRTTLS